MALYHYTDVNAVKSILENRKLWLTDIRFLNDSSEFHDGIAYFRKALKSPKKGLFSNPKYADEAIEYLANSLSEKVGFRLAEEPLFTCSFSRSDDLLSQWRAYGAYAVEFDEHLLLESLEKLVECRYVDDDKTNIASHELTNAISKVSRSMERHNGCLGEDAIDALIHLVNVAASFKNHGFHEERELRVIRTIDSREESIRFRAKGNRLIPYIEVEISLDCIKSICLGPMPEQGLAEASMRMFARHIEKKWQFDSSNVEYELNVTASPIPYRST